MRKRLTDILRGDGAARLQTAWAATEAAQDLGPIPAGEYDCRVIAGELVNSRSRGTPGYKLTFEVIDGEHKGRRVWHDVWLSEAALPLAKRELSRLGIMSLEQLEAPLPQGIRCAVKVVLRRDDDGGEYNRVKSFEVVGIDEPAVDPFAPTDGTLLGATPPDTVPNAALLDSDDDAPPESTEDLIDRLIVGVTPPDNYPYGGRLLS